MRPSKSKLMPRRSKPQVLFLSGLMAAFEGFECAFPEPACRVKTATPEVTANTTRYLYKGYLRWKSVMWRNMTGSNLQLFARMKVI